MGTKPSVSSIRTKSRISASATAAFLILSYTLSPGTALGQWSFDPVLRVAADIDDNATLSPRTDEEEQLEGYIGEASLGMFYNTATTDFSLRPILRSRRYDSDLNRDSDDQFLRMRYSFKGETNDFRIRADYSREGVRTAEIIDADLDAEVDPDEIEDDDTGEVTFRGRRHKFRVVPRWDHQISEVSSFASEINIVSTTYDQDFQTNRLFDYTDARLRLAYRRSISQRTTFSVIGTGRHYDSDRLTEATIGYGLSAGINTDLSETSTLRAYGGLESTEVEGTSTEPNFVGDLSYVRRMETIQFLAQYRRRISASGRGSLRARDEINLRLTRDLTEKVSAGLGLRAQQTDALDGSAADQTSIQLHAGVGWRISQAFAITANYRYTVLDREAVGESANSNRFTLWLNYQPNSETMFRFR